MSAPHQFLRHLHLPGITPFTYAQALQHHLVTLNLRSKPSRSNPTPTTPPPPPTLLTFTPTPVYAFGRRSPSSSLTPSERRQLRQPSPRAPDTLPPPQQHAALIDTLRGGLTTFHGPGQLVVYPTLDLKRVQSARFPRGLGVRDYVCLLEQATIDVLRRWDIRGRRTENPGVWVTPDPGSGQQGGGKGEGEEVEQEDRKIAALGVHLRRNVTGYGVGLNVCTDLGWFERIVACGLEGKKTTSMRELREGRGALHAALGREGEGSGDEQLMRVLGRQWAEEFAKGLWGQAGEGKVVEVEREDLGISERELKEMVVEEASEVD